MNTDIEVPNAALIDMFLPMHTASLDSDFGDIRATKHVKSVALDDGTQADFPIIQGFGSSEIEDTDGDTFTEPALKSLCVARPGLAVWKDHSFRLFDDYMGKLAEPPEFIYATSKDWPNTGAIPHNADKWAGVWIKVALETENPPAAMLHKFVKRKHQFGFSVGCMYTKYQQKRDKRGVAKGFQVYEVRPVEWSVVGVPANQASWVDTTKKMLVAKGFMGLGETLTNPNAELLYKLKSFPDLPEKDAVLLRRLMEGLESRFGLSLGVPFEDGAPKRVVY